MEPIKKLEAYRRNLIPLERRFLRAPNSNVILVLRIRGELSTKQFSESLKKVQQRHRLLQTCIAVDEAGNAWFTSEDVGDIEIDEIARHSAQDWIQASLDSHRLPFDFARQSPVRFTLLRTPDTVDIIIICHHIICDGLSLAYLAQDILDNLAHPDREIEVLPDPVPAERKNFRKDISFNLKNLQSTVNDLNDAWAKQKVLFDEDDYRDLFQSFWRHFSFNALSLEFTKSQTTRLLQCCRDEQVTVNTGLLICLLRAQYHVQGDSEDYLHRTGTAVSTRKFMERSPDKAMGLYAAGAMFEFRYQANQPLWHQARLLHEKIRQYTAAEKILLQLARFDCIEPTLLDAVQFKRFGQFVRPQQQRYKKLSEFCSRKDMLADMEAEKRKEAKRGLVLTNLAQLEFSQDYGDLELENVFFYPGTNEFFEKTVGATTVNGMLTLVISYVGECIDDSVVGQFIEVLRAQICDEFGN
ncbi:MAG: hypothetical protein GY896_07455 [Gammaproteobacteria bacterium]|nr:hypothetical protein [Gammaproteobacteria bacterium]